MRRINGRCAVWMGVLSLAFGTATALRAQSAAQSDKRSQSGSYSLLYSFQCIPDGNNPAAPLVRDSAGNLYGITRYGGNPVGGVGMGTVFKVSPVGTETVLHTFAGPPSDGEYPVASLILDAAGNLYGTTPDGGEFGGGTVFEVTATGTESILYNFCARSHCRDGYFPSAGMARDHTGNLYGTASLNGEYGGGVIFKLSPDGTYTVLHSFNYSSTDGSYPESNVTMDSSGNLYSTTTYGGTSYHGTVFKVTASGTESLLYSFKGWPVDGAAPGAMGLLRDTSGNFYGVTAEGGENDLGVLFKLTPGATESVNLNFTGLGGGYPGGVLVRDEAGNLYGVAGGGPVKGDRWGVLYKLAPDGRETVLHDFTLTSSSDGGGPAGLTEDSSGDLYGALYYGGAYGCGAVFKYTP